MKKLAILLLSIFTIGTACLCACEESKGSSNTENETKIQVQETEDKNNQTCPECPDGKKRHGICPEPRRPHIRPPRLPHPKPSNINK